MTAALAISPTRAFGFPTVQEYKPLARFLDHDALAELLMEVRGAKIVTVETRTEPRLLAKHPVTGAPNPFKGNVVKVSSVNGMINFRYEASVIRQRVREGLAPDFEALPRKWGVRLPGTPLIEHDGRLYLELKVERTLDHRYETFDGKSLDSIRVGAFVPSRGPSRQEVSREVILRDYGLASIVSIRLGGVVYLVRASEAVVENETPARRSA